MSKLACNIAMYHPDLKILASRYRTWHVKEILNEAATLIERCIIEYREYYALDYDWNRFRLDLTTQEKDIDLHRRRETEEPPESEPAVTEEDEVATALSETEEEPAPEMLGTAAEAELPFEQPPEPVPVTMTKLDLRSEEAQRKRELSAPGQPFALNEQRDLTLKRLCRDYEEAVDRAWVAEQGLRKIYDHSQLATPLPSGAETLSESITHLAIWVRDAREWLARYQQHEESFTRVVSVRSQLGRNAWALLKHSRDSYSLKFRMPPELFQGHDNCHLKGVGAWLVGDAGSVPWSMIVRLPEEAMYERWGQRVEVDQSARPSCLLGRVQNNRSAQPVEICGTNSLLNATPIGQGNQEGLWSLEIYKPLGATSESFSHLEDVVLELSATGIPQRTM